MNALSRPESLRDLPSASLLTFLAMTFLITSCVIAAHVVWLEATAAIFGEISGSHSLFILATWSPAIAGVVALFIHAGMAGLRAFLSWLMTWRYAPGSVAFTLIGLAARGVSGPLRLSRRDRGHFAARRDHRRGRDRVCRHEGGPCNDARDTESRPCARRRSGGPDAAGILYGTGVAIYADTPRPTEKGEHRCPGPASD
jgi:hypothetical protein